LIITKIVVVDAFINDTDYHVDYTSYDAEFHFK